jgi:hypothetical protein
VLNHDTCNKLYCYSVVLCFCLCCCLFVLFVLRGYFTSSSKTGTTMQEERTGRGLGRAKRSGGATGF